MTGPVIFRRARPAYLTPDAFAQHFGVSKMTVYRLIDAGEVHANRIGRALRIPVAEVKRYADATRIEPTTEEKTA